MARIELAALACDLRLKKNKNNVDLLTMFMLCRNEKSIINRYEV